MLGFDSFCGFFEHVNSSTYFGGGDKAEICVMVCLLTSVFSFPSL